MGERWQPSGVAGLEPRPSAGVSVQIGRRDKKGGVPIEKDRFHLMLPHEDDGMKGFHPDFAFFNEYSDRAAPAEVAKRKVLGGIIAHGSWDYREGGCLEQHLSAQKLPGRPPPPSREPACVGDGRVARRWFGEKGPADWRRIESCGDACPFRKPVSDREGPPCKPLTRFLFRLDWTGSAAAARAPTPIAKMASGSFYTFVSVGGLKTALDDAARTLGIDPATVSPFGLRFRLAVQNRTKPGKRFPVVVATLVDSAVDHILRSLQQRDQIRALAANAPTLAIGDDSYAADVRATSGPVMEGT